MATNRQSYLKKKVLNFVENLSVLAIANLQLVDAANYTKEGWEKVTNETIKNALIKADLK